MISANAQHVRPSQVTEPDLRSKLKGRELLASLNLRRGRDVTLVGVGGVVYVRSYNGISFFASHGSEAGKIVEYTGEEHTARMVDHELDFANLRSKSIDNPESIDYKNYQDALNTRGVTA